MLDSIYHKSLKLFCNHVFLHEKSGFNYILAATCDFQQCGMYTQSDQSLC